MARTNLEQSPGGSRVRITSASRDSSMRFRRDAPDRSVFVQKTIENVSAITAGSEAQARWPSKRLSHSHQRESL